MKLIIPVLLVAMLGCANKTHKKWCTTHQNYKDVSATLKKLRAQKFPPQNAIISVQDQRFKLREELEMLAQKYYKDEDKLLRSEDCESE